jgi:hypothetical protein
MPAVDEPAPRNYAVAGNDLILHPEVAAAMDDELVDFLERVWIEQEIDAFARGELAGGVLSLETVFAAAELRPPLEICKSIVRICHG